MNSLLINSICFAAAGHVDQHVDISYIIVKSFLYVSYSQSLVGLLMFVEGARNPYYVYSLVPEAYGYGSWPLLVIFCLFEYPFYICLWQYCIFLFIMLFPYFYGTLYWLREIIHQTNRPNRLSSESTYAIYKCFQILTQEFNCCFAVLGLPAVQFYLIAVAVMCNHILIRHAHELNPSAISVSVCFSCVAFFCVFVIFPRAAAVNSLSTRFIKTLRAKAQAQADPGGPRPSIRRTINKKQVRACFPLKIWINSYAYVIRFTTVKIVGLIFYWTARSVLLTRK